MKPTFGRGVVIAALLAAALGAVADVSRAADPALAKARWRKEPGTYAIFETSLGPIVCKLFPDVAPRTVANFIGLATGTKEWTDPKTKQKVKRPFFDGQVFHRVIADFMIQGGDSKGDGTGGPGYEFEDEIDGHTLFDRAGRLGMANSGPNTNGSQFFITQRATPHLNGRHTIFGQVVQGQQVVNAICQTPCDANDRPKKPISFTVTIEEIKPPE